MIARSPRPSRTIGTRQRRMECHPARPRNLGVGIRTRQIQIGISQTALRLDMRVQSTHGSKPGFENAPRRKFRTPARHERPRSGSSSPSKSRDRADHARRARASRSPRSHRKPAERRTANCDDFEDFRRRRLPLERFLGLVEQPHVLDRDHRLVGEGPEQTAICFFVKDGPPVPGDDDQPTTWPSRIIGTP